MKRFNSFLPLSIVVILMLVFVAGCNNSNPDDNDFPDEYSFSDGLDDNGFFTGIRALDYVDLFNHSAFPVPADVHYVSDLDIEFEIENILRMFPGQSQIFDRPVADGDEVNIDYVGSIDGVEFAGGSSEGFGSYVTAGTPQFIDDFLWQIIGMMPGETKDVYVNFPDVYSQAPDLAGKRALFVTTINYIVGHGELTDEFIATNFHSMLGWSNKAEMVEGIRKDIQTDNVRGYVNDLFDDESMVRSIPDRLLRLQERTMLNFYHETAIDNNMTFEEFIEIQTGATNTEELIAFHYEEIRSIAIFHLIIQAVAEDAGLVVTLEDIANYFYDFAGSYDYSDFEDIYGLPYLKQVILIDKVFDHVVQNAVLT